MIYQARCVVSHVAESRCVCACSQEAAIEKGSGGHQSHLGKRQTTEMGTKKRQEFPQHRGPLMTSATGLLPHTHK